MRKELKEPSAAKLFFGQLHVSSLSDWPTLKRAAFLNKHDLHGDAKVLDAKIPIL